MPLKQHVCPKPPLSAKLVSCQALRRCCSLPPGEGAAPCGAWRVRRSSHGAATGTRSEPPAWRRDNHPQAETCDARGLVASLSRHWPRRTQGHRRAACHMPLQPVPFCRPGQSLQTSKAFITLQENHLPQLPPPIHRLPREKPQLCWARAENKGTAKHLPAKAFAPSPLSPAEAPGQQQSIGRKQHFWSAWKSLPIGHFS